MPSPTILNAFLLKNTFCPKKSPHQTLVPHPTGLTSPSVGNPGSATVTSSLYPHGYALERHEY